MAKCAGRPCPKGTRRSQGSGIREPEAGRRTILRRFVEDLMGKGLPMSRPRGRRRGLPAPVRTLPARYWMVIPSFSVRDLKALYCFSTNALVSSGPWT